MRKYLVIWLACAQFCYSANPQPKPASSRVRTDAPKNPFALFLDKTKNTFELREEIAKGAFSKVCRAKHKETGTNVIAKKSVDEGIFNLEDERRILRHLGAHDPDILKMGIPQVLKFEGGEDKATMYMTKFKYDYSHEKLQNPSWRDLQTSMVSWFQTMELLQRHEILHLDLKPKNLVKGGEEVEANAESFIGKTWKNMSGIIDFGLSQFYIRDKRKHSETVVNKIFASRNLVKYLLPGAACYPPSPMDDLESVIYLSLYSINKLLSWVPREGNRIATLTILREKEAFFKSTSDYLDDILAEVEEYSRAFNESIQLSKPLEFGTLSNIKSTDRWL